MFKESVARVVDDEASETNVVSVHIDSAQLAARISRRWSDWGAVHALTPSPKRTAELEEIWNDIGRLNGVLSKV